MGRGKDNQGSITALKTAANNSGRVGQARGFQILLKAPNGEFIIKKFI